MNDSEELSYCNGLYNQDWVDVCRERGVPEEQIDHKVTGFGNPHICESDASEMVGSFVPAHYYVFCTCVVEDSPMMWAKYTGGEGVGRVPSFIRYELGQVLKTVAVAASRCGIRAEVLSGRVLYEKDEQLRKIKLEIRRHLKELEMASAEAANDPDRIMNKEIVRSSHWGWVEELAPLLKRPEFGYENEHRFVFKKVQSELPQELSDSSKEKSCAEEAKLTCGLYCSQRSERPLSLGYREGSNKETIPYYEIQLGKSLGSALHAAIFRLHESSPRGQEELSQLIGELGYRNISIENIG